MEPEKIQNARAFYESWEWCELRTQALKEQGYQCRACGIGREDGAVMTVDHVLPRGIWPEYALDPGNLQVLCFQCNRGKGTNTTDFRMARFPRRRDNNGGAANDPYIPPFQMALPL